MNLPRTQKKPRLPDDEKHVPPERLWVGWFFPEAAGVAYSVDHVSALTRTMTAPLLEYVRHDVVLKIKPLVWTENPDKHEGGMLAVGLFGVCYHATDNGWTLHREMKWFDAADIEAAQAAAQADYEQSIRSVLIGEWS